MTLSSYQCQVYASQTPSVGHTKIFIFKENSICIYVQVYILLMKSAQLRVHSISTGIQEV